ncbi:MAG TPA: hypothetical protein VIN08_25245 [Ohtaekwangia sp.]|uniref:hypothetical protein n=1 Tax=Ohtaekwangia sp. TaxID=2066019 RepID=UPI002F92C5FA
MKFRYILYGLVGLGMIILIPLLLLWHETDDLCVKGSGPTTVHVKVYDKFTNKRIDSVQLAIRYGVSMDRIVDTLLYQPDRVSYQWTVPENDCDPYWIEVSNEHYWVDLDDTTMNHEIQKGRVNEYIVHLKPATTVILSLTRDRSDKSTDTVYLYMKKGDQPYDRWSYFSLDDFEDTSRAEYIASYVIHDVDGKRTISSDIPVESGVAYKVRWIRKEKNYIDTIYTDFKAIPFDTVTLKYEFTKLK